MSQGQQPYDQNVMKDRISPRDVDDQNKAVQRQQEAETENQPNDERWVPPGNKEQGSRKD